MSNAWADGTYTAAYAVEKVRGSSPIPGVATEYVWTQRFWIYQANFAALALNTAHADDSNFKLVAESERSPLGGGVVEWTRTYAKVPAQHLEAEVAAYNFIGYWGTFGVNATAATGRPKVSRAVACKVQNDYFLVDGVTYVKPTDIPIIASTRYYQPPYPNQDVDYLGDAPPLILASVPSRSSYDGWIASDAGGDNWHIVMEASRLSRWMGNIWRRETRYIKAI